MDGDTDIKSLEVMNQIRGDIARTAALVGGIVDLSQLAGEISEPNLSNKLEQIARSWTHIRRIRPDGNCFYRAYLFGVLERSLTTIGELRTEFAKLAEMCKRGGYDSFAIDDFHDLVQEQLNALESTPSLNTLENEVFADPSVDGYLIAFMRCCTGAYMKLHADEFSDFMPSTFASIEAFVRTEVDPMFKDCDELQIVAITNAFKVPLSVVYLDRSPGEPAIHSFGLEDAPGTSPVCMLYRPGHYDLLYR